MSGQSGSGGDGWGDFLNGLKVMVVDDDPLCLKVVEHMLRRCSYTGRTHALKHTVHNLWYLQRRSTKSCCCSDYLP